MFCPKCGEKIDREDLFCLNCGASVTKPTSKPAGGRKRSSLRTWILVVVLVLVFGTGGGLATYYLLGRSNPEASIASQQNAEKTLEQIVAANDDPMDMSLKQAITDLELAVKQDASNVTARDSLGSCYILDGRMAEALVQYDAILNQEPSNAFAQEMVNLLQGEEGTP